MTAGRAGEAGLQRIEERLGVIGQQSALQHALNVRAEIRHVTASDLASLHSMQLAEEASFVAAAKCGTVPAETIGLVDATSRFAEALETNREFRDRLGSDKQLGALVNEIERLDKGKQQCEASIRRAEQAGLGVDSSDRNDLRDVDFQLRAFLQRNGATMPVPLPQDNVDRSAASIPSPSLSKPGAK